MKYILIVILNIWAFSASSQYLNWMRTFGGNGYDEGYSATQLADSSYIIVGSTSSFYNSNQNVLFLRVDSTGNFLHSNFINNGGYERGNKIIEINNDQFWIAGFTNSFGNGGFDGYLVKTDITGRSHCPVLFEQLRKQRNSLGIFFYRFKCKTQSCAIITNTT